MNITKQQFEAYEKVRQSGATNMFDVRQVSELSGLTREECLEIMKNYGKYKVQFMSTKEKLQMCGAKITKLEIEWKTAERAGDYETYKLKRDAWLLAKKEFARLSRIYRKEKGL